MLEATVRGNKWVNIKLTVGVMARVGLSGRVGVRAQLGLSSGRLQQKNKYILCIVDFMTSI